MNKSLLLDYVTDHYKQFKSYPMDYEAENGQILTFEQIMEHLTEKEKRLVEHGSNKEYFIAGLKSELACASNQDDRLFWQSQLDNAQQEEKPETE